MRFAHGIVLRSQQRPPKLELGVAIQPEPVERLDASFWDAYDEIIDYDFPQLIGEPEPLL